MVGGVAPADAAIVDDGGVTADDIALRGPGDESSVASEVPDTRSSGRGRMCKARHLLVIGGLAFVAVAVFVVMMISTRASSNKVQVPHVSQTTNTTPTQKETKKCTNTQHNRVVLCTPRRPTRPAPSRPALLVYTRSFTRPFLPTCVLSTRLRQPRRLTQASSTRHRCGDNTHTHAITHNHSHNSPLLHHPPQQQHRTRMELGL